MTDFKCDVGILLCDEGMRQKAEEVADRHHINIVSDETPCARYVVFSEGFIALRSAEVQGGDLYVDFAGGKSLHRLRSGEGRGQTLAKAVGLKGGVTPSVLDLTAGLGRDAFVLASLGCFVTLLERSPWLSLLLEDGLRRASESDVINDISPRMNLNNIDARDFLKTLYVDNLPDVIYMDPMYPGRNKSALVKKEMRIIRAFVGDDQDTEEVLSLALSKAKKRIVVKRPKGAECIGSGRPNFQVESKNTRYDVYLPQQQD